MVFTVHCTVHYTGKPVSYRGVQRDIVGVAIVFKIKAKVLY